MVWVIADVFDEKVGMGADFPLYDKRHFGDSIALLARKPNLCEHATEAPTASNLPRPRELDIRIITRTRDPARPGGEAQPGCRGEHNIAGKRSKLHLDGRHHVRKPSRVSTVNGTEIVGQIDEELNTMGHTQPNSRICTVDASRSAARSQIDPILCLQAASRDDKAGVGYVRSICQDLALAIWAIFSGRSRRNLSPERGEEQRKQQPGPKGIYERQLTVLRAA